MFYAMVWYGTNDNLRESSLQGKGAAAAAHGDHQRPPTPLFFDSCVPLRSVMIINTKR